MLRLTLLGMLAAGVFACASARPPPPEPPAPAPTVPAPPPPSAPPGPVPASAAELAFLHCARQHESRQDYSVVSANRLYYGAYQFTRETWEGVARHTGREDLVDVSPNRASEADQDAMALALYRWRGSEPWGGRCSKRKR